MNDSFSLTKSVPRSMNRIVMTPSGSGTEAIINRRKGVISGMFDVSVYAIDFFKLSNINRPGYKLDMRSKLCN